MGDIKPWEGLCQIVLCAWDNVVGPKVLDTWTLNDLNDSTSDPVLVDVHNTNHNPPPDHSTSNQGLEFDRVRQTSPHKAPEHAGCHQKPVLNREQHADNY